MPADIGKVDLRSMKTEKALDIAMFSLLNNRNFRKITVKDICGEAQISRATFYAHFIDKYNLLEYWLMYLKPEGINKDDCYEQIEKTVNQFIHKHATIIKNLIYDADDQTLDILFNSILSTFGFNAAKYDNGKTNPKYVVLSNFYVGGVFNYFLWQVKNKFPSDVMPMNVYLYEIITKFHEQNF